MTTLKVYDTVLEAKNNAINDYRDYAEKGLEKGIDVKFHAIHPYKIKINDGCYVYAANNPRYLLGMRFDKIEDYTIRTSIRDEIRACEYDNT